VLGQPVSGVRVQSLASGLGGAVVTGNTGAYSLPALSGFEIVSVSNAPGSTVVWPRQQTTSILGITNLDITVQLTAGYGSVTTVTNADTVENTVINTGRSSYSAEVVLPAGSVLDSNGLPATDVVVSVANNVISDTGFANVFPGFFLGTPLVGSVIPIESFGFMEVRLTDTTGLEQYTLDPAVGATIFIPVNPDPVGIDTIPLWRLDEATGIWEETGAALRVGSTNVFEADVTSFSVYNLDRPLASSVTLTVTAYNSQSTLAAGVSVTVDVTSTGDFTTWQGRGITGQNGQLVLVVPPGYLSVVGKKGTETYNGYSYDEGVGTASIDLYYYAPRLNPPPDPGPGGFDPISVILAVGTDFENSTTFLVVQNASVLAEFWSAGGDWRPAELLYDFSVVGIVGNTIQLNGPVDLTSFNLELGSTVTFESNI
jgi:hypothetical protein